MIEFALFYSLVQRNLLKAKGHEQIRYLNPKRFF